MMARFMADSILAYESPGPSDRAGRGSWWVLALLLTINLFNYIDRSVLAAVEPEVRRHVLNEPVPAATNLPANQAMGQTPATHYVSEKSDYKVKTAWLATAFLLSYMVMAPVFGYLADRTSRWKLVGSGVIIWSLASGATGVTGSIFGSYVLMLVSRVFVGVGEAAYGPAAPTIISDLFPVARRGMVLAWFYMAIPIGSAIGYMLGGFITEHLGGWQWSFYLVVPPGVLLGLICFFIKDPPRGMSDSGAHRHAKFADYVALFKNPSYMLATLGMAAMTFAIGGISFFMPAYLTENRHAIPGALSETAALAKANFYFGAILAVGGLAATLLGGITGDRVRRRFAGSYFLVSGIAIIISVLFIYLMMVASFPWAWGFIFIAVFFLFFNTGPANTILANVTHPSVRSTAFALNIFLIHILGDVPSPPILGYMAEHQGWNAAFHVVCGLMAVGGLVWLLGVRHLARDTERASLEPAIPLSTS